MLWSLAKALLFFALVAVLTWGAALLSETGGGIRISMLGWEVTLGPLQAAIAAILLVVAIWLLMRIAGLTIAILRFLTGDETALSRHFDRNRERRGYAALSEALMALASGEHRVAAARAAKAEKLLAKPELTTLIKAEAAQASGDRVTAEAAYRELLADDRSRFVGVRGLMKLKLEQGDTETAMKLAEKALALKPKHGETQDILLQLQTGGKDWHGARLTLGSKLKSGGLPKDVWRRRDAVLALQEARVLLDDASSVEAREAAIAANKASPDLIPAAAMAARSYIAQGNGKAAARVLRKAWEAQPHPDLAAAFAEIVPEETASDRVRRFHALTDIKPDHEETRLLMAELNIAAEDFPAARRALGSIAVDHPTTRALAIMAAIERGSGADDAVVRGWLARALTAPRGPQWVCQTCHAIHTAWAPICENCAGFDTLAWAEPPETSGPSPTQTEMLPLIVGRPEAAGPEMVEVPDAEVLEPEVTGADLSEPAPPVTPDELARKGAF
ncbi:HemY protein [Gemmobacter megaterium]|uniref:HemY protein n=1 Tax=Gemmobacter megaterium TaxID=1086013 RepID=A0A1N7PVK2_9RHOB|nr:heme biosynthesis HemY N-terminal domain-containing protein [Gemmobacter megaterium]GGE21666.1 heme biosynthesis protein HemY [Gemmobacter megaterium]SIT14654.1 HemY protein [Gemmobacter megaterium]